MKSIRLEKPGEIKLAKIDIPNPKSEEALIKVKSVGICGSDIAAFKGANPLVTYPRTIGHEIAGEILAIPENSKGLKVGDRVIVDPYLYCGHCYPCSLGRTNCCEDLKVLGVHVEGGMVEYFTHPAEMLYKVPEDMSWEIIPLAEPLTIAIHGLHRAKLTSGEHIVISGAGPIGLLAAMAALYYGAVPIIIDPVAERLEKSRELGVKYTINPLKEDLVQKVKDYTNGRMSEVVMEASGANAAILNTLNIVSNAGRIILTGWPKNDTLMPTATITKKEVDIRGARTSAGEFEEAIELIHGQKVDVGSILTKVVSLEETPETVIDIEKRPQSYLKVNVLID